MDKKIKYDQLEKSIRSKTNDFSDEYGKSWDRVAEELDNKKVSNRKKGIFAALIALSIIMVSIFTFYFSSNIPEDVKYEGEILKKEQKNIETEISSIDPI